MSDLTEVLFKVNHLINETTPQVQKIFSTPHFVSFGVRFKGITKWLYLGRGGPYQGLYLYDLAPDSKYRIKDQFLEYMRRHLRGNRILCIIPFKKHFGLIIEYQGVNGIGAIAFCWDKGRLYFAHLNAKGKIFISWEGKYYEQSELNIESIQGLESVFHFCEQKKDNVKNKTIEQYFNELEQILELRGRGLKVISKKKKYLLIKINNINKDLEKLKKWKILYKEVENEKYDFAGKYKISLCGVTFKLNTKFNHNQNKNIIYKKAKAWKKAIILQESRLRNVEQELELLQENKIVQNTDISFIKTIIPVFGMRPKNIKQINKEKTKLGKDFVYQGQILKLGLSAKENDQIRKVWAKKDDWWFHVEAQKSGHLFAKLKALPTPEFLQLVGSILRDHSKLQTTEISLIYTQIKFLKGIKGRPGAVLTKKVRHLRVIYLKDWQAILS